MSSPKKPVSRIANLAAVVADLNRKLDRSAGAKHRAHSAVRGQSIPTTLLTRVPQRNKEGIGFYTFRVTVARNWTKTRRIGLVYVWGYNEKDAIAHFDGLVDSLSLGNVTVSDAELVRFEPDLIGVFHRNTCRGIDDLIGHKTGHVETVAFMSAAA